MIYKLLLDIKLDRPKFHKHLKSKTNSASLIPSSDEEIIFGVKTKNLESAIPKCFPKKSTFTLKETKIKETSIPEFKADPVSSEFTSAEMCSGENTRKIEIPMLGTLNETVLPTQTKSQDSSIDLISVEEDKYSALREIKLEVDLSATKPASNSEEINDEFGDFLSADIPSLGSELSSFQNNSKVPTDLLLDDEGENWREWTFKTEPENENSGSACSKDPIIDSTSEKDFEPFNLLYLDDQKNKISNYSAPQEQQDILNISIPPIDFESFKEKDNDFGSGKMNLELHQPASPQVTNTQPDYELLNLFGNPVQSAFNNFNKHDSLPSLDFQISPNEESEQETIWRKCLEMCQNLIQEGVDIFNKVDKKSVLDEIFATPKTNEYLNCKLHDFKINQY